jgi:ribonuclease HIII
MARRKQLRGFDLKKMEGLDALLGVDEAGRGALAGPVCAAAVTMWDRQMVTAHESLPLLACETR